jgi:hypothetical protein
VVAGFREERGTTVLTRGAGAVVGFGQRWWRTRLQTGRGATTDNAFGRALFITGHSVTEGRCPGWLIGKRHVATRPAGGPHMSAKFQFLEIPENMFPRSKNR